MKNTLVFDRKALATLLVALVWGAVCSTVVQAQTAGETGICNTTTTVCPPADVTGSVAIIDASAVTHGANICDTIYRIITGLTTSTFTPGAVIDARGISSNLTCASSESPWFESGTYANAPSTILLPAQTIVIKYPWILPSGTKLIGEGPGSTTIKVCGSSCFSGSWMIEFAQSSATGISVEQLELNGDAQTSPGGILNEYAQDSSYVDHVSLYEILGTGLEITGSAQNSGPYSNITYNTNNNASSSATCVDLYNVSGGTRGIHGLTCIGDSSDHAPVAVYLDSSNNSLEDVTIAGFSLGIVVGSQSAAQSNVLVNIVGDTNQGIVVAPIDVVYVPSSSNTVSDLSMMGVTNLGTGGGIYSIYDARTGTYLPDTNVAMYALGKSTPDGYSRFTTSPNAATWAVGSSTTPGSAPVRQEAFIQARAVRRLRSGSAIIPGARAMAGTLSRRTSSYHRVTITRHPLTRSGAIGH